MKIYFSAFIADYVLGLPLPITGAYIAGLGAIIGSFLNVVIHRVPRDESIVFPNSRCPACAAAIHPLDNIPVISYLILRGRCRKCKAHISLRYPAVELMTAGLYIIVFLSHVYLRGGVTLMLAFDLIFVTGLVALVFIDAEHYLLPNVITYPGIVLAVVARLLIPYVTGPQAFDDLSGLMNGPLAGWPMWAASLAGALLGALAGGGSLWLMGWLWEKLRGVEAMGLGDVKMMFAVGAYLGWRLTIVTIFLAVLAGSLTGIFLMLRRREKNMQMLLPFGIFLGTGAIVALLIGARIVTWYAGQFIPR